MLKMSLKHIYWMTALCLFWYSEPFPIFAQTTGPGGEQSALVNNTVVVPDHIVQFENELEPDWKVIWDQARQLSREKKYREAIVQYELLLARKENVDEARWEYTSILLHLERWRKAKTQLEILRNHDPGQKKYLFALAEVTLAAGDFDRAAQLYGQLYGQSPDSKDAVRALEGLVRALEMQGHREALLPLMEQLILRKPNDPVLQKKFSRLAMQLNQTDKAGETIEKLLRSNPDDPEVVLLMARLQEKLSHDEKAAGYWKRLIVLKPDDQEARRRLIRFYRSKRNWPRELKHLEALLKITPDNVELLERGAELNMKLGRVDHALEYYDWYLTLKPEDSRITKKKQQAEKLLAHDLLALVENSGSRMLWQDLVRVTSDRAGVYHAIADLLREKGKINELIDVLTIMYRENPGDEAVGLELVSLLKKKGRVTEAQTLLNGMKRLGHDKGISVSEGKQTEKK